MVIFVIMPMFAVCIIGAARSSFHALFLFVRNNESSVANDAFSLRSFLSSDDLVTFTFLRKSNKTQYIYITDTLVEQTSNICPVHKSPQAPGLDRQQANPINSANFFRTLSHWACFSSGDCNGPPQQTPRHKTKQR